MAEQTLTSASAEVDPIRNGDLVDEFSALVGGALPDELVRTELLQDRTGRGASSRGGASEPC